MASIALDDPQSHTDIMPCQIHVAQASCSHRKVEAYRPHAHAQRDVRAAPAAASAAKRRKLLSGGGAVILLALAPAVPPAADALPPLAPASADSTLEQQYDQYSSTYDELDDGPLASALGFPELRSELLAHACGQVLEVGVGTGLNLPRYSADGSVRSITAVDLSGGMLAMARRRAAALGMPPARRGGGSRSSSVASTSGRPAVEFVQADVTALPLPPASFDTVVDTFGLCVFADPLSALRGMARMLRPGGRLLLLEHARSDWAPLRAYQDATASTVAAMGKGCVWNQDVLGLVQQVGLEPLRMTKYLGGLVVAIEAAAAGAEPV